MKQPHRIKVFLGGYVNSQNAQNINCRSLSEHFDKEKFEIWTMITWHGWPKNNDFERTPGVHYIYDTPLPWTEKMHLPYWLFAWMAYAIGIMRCDVAYLPKGEYVRFCHLVARISGCKLYTTLEGILAGTNLEKLLALRGNLDCYRSFEPNLYGITKFIAHQANRDHGLQFQNKVLYLGVEAKKFASPDAVRQSKLSRIVFIGNNTKYKGLEDVLHMAKLFPDLEFHCVGGNIMKEGTLEIFVYQHSLTNVTYHGTLDHNQLSDLLPSMDLMFFPSRSEGFPKVMLETACAGVPTLCYSDYGADEWITSGKNGFVVNTFDEAKTVIQDLLDHPEKLQPLSDAAVELGRSFDWKVLVKDWEKEIESIYNEK